MIQGEESGSKIDLALLERLDKAVSEYQQGGSADQLREWVKEEIDRNGFPRRLARESWDDALALVSRSVVEGRDLPKTVVLQFGRWAEGLRAFRGSDGSAYWAGSAPSKRTKLSAWVDQMPFAGLSGARDNGAKRPAGAKDGDGLG